MANDGRALRTPPRSVRVTFVGHSTLLVQTPDLNVLTDPVLGPLPCPLPRATPPSPAPRNLPPIDVVVLSHAHYDHLDIATLSAFGPETTILCPRHIKGVFAANVGARVEELSPWEERVFGGTRVVAVPNRHHNLGRPGIPAQGRYSTLAYLIESGAQRVVFLGDTAWTGQFAAIGKRFPGIRVALVPIGAYWPRWIFSRNHLDPAQALDALDALGAETMVPIHWGAFRLTLERVATPPRELRRLTRERGLSARVCLLRGGESWEPA